MSYFEEAIELMEKLPSLMGVNPSLTTITITVLSVCWLFFRHYIWKGLNTKEDREFLHKLIEYDLWSVYRRQLERFLDFTALNWFKDKDALDKRRIHDSHRNALIAKAFGSNAFSSESFDFHLKLALVYPMLSILIVWLLTGEGGTINGIELFRDNVSTSQRSVSAIAIVCVLFFLLKSGWKGIPYSLGAVARAHALVFALVFALAGPVVAAVVAAVGVGVVVAGLVAGLVDGVVDGVGTGVGDLALIIAFAFAFAFAFATENFVSKRRNLVFIVFLPVTTAALVFTSYYENTDSSLLLLLVFLPLLNAPLDWLSTGVTRSLLYAITDKEHGGWQVFIWFCLDFILAVFFLFVITVCLITAVSAVNAIAVHTGGDLVFDFNALFEKLRVPLSPSNWWIYVMLLSTLLPTLLHLLLASLSVILWFPNRLKDLILKGWKNEHSNDSEASKGPDDSFFRKKAAFFYLTIFGPLSLAAPLLLLVGMYHLLHVQENGYYLGGQLLKFAQWMAY